MKDNTMTSGLSQRVWESKARRYLSASLTSKLKRLKEKQMVKDLQDWLRDGQSGTILYFLPWAWFELLYRTANLSSPWSRASFSLPIVLSPRNYFGKRRTGVVTAFSILRQFVIQSMLIRLLRLAWSRVYGLFCLVFHLPWGRVWDDEADEGRLSLVLHGGIVTGSFPRAVLRCPCLLTKLEPRTERCKKKKESIRGSPALWGK